jgi:hypothetical protein
MRHDGTIPEATPRICDLGHKDKDAPAQGHIPKNEALCSIAARVGCIERPRDQ